jgi:tripartite ATP-independent transporter DctM subunit
MTLIIVLAVLAIFLSGSPLFIVMLAACAFGTAVTDRGFDTEFYGAVEKMFGTATSEQSEVLSTIPMFIYVGYILAESKMADRLVRFANAGLGWMPGGLAIVTILTCAVFTVFTGASGVTIIALGGVLMPALVRAGYPKRFAMGLIAGTGSVGLLFIPALPLFIYGAVAGLNVQKDWVCTGDQALDAINMAKYHGAACWPAWDTQRFLLAGTFPGLLLIAMLSIVAVTVAIKNKLPRQKFSADELAKSLLAVLPELIIPGGVILGLANGFGPSEVAALTVLYVVILEVVILRMVKLKTLWNVSREAMAMVGAIFVIIFSAIAFTDYLINQHVPQAMVAWTQEHVQSKIAFLLAVNVILLVVGTVMDIFSAIVIVLPLVIGMAHAYGIDPYHLGIIFLLNLEVGYLHPPVGLNLFITSVKFQRPIGEVMWATIPFLLTMIVALGVITYVPTITTSSVNILAPPERTGRIADLSEMVHTAIEEKRALKEVTLVAADGTVLNDDAGQPIVVKAGECDKLEGEKRDNCRNIFFYADECKRDPKPDDCTHKRIAGWTRRNKQLFIVKEIALVDDDNKPVMKDGAPIVKKLADCDSETDADSKQVCRDLFAGVSACKIDPQGKTIEACTFDLVTKWVRDNN